MEVSIAARAGPRHAPWLHRFGMQLGAYPLIPPEPDGRMVPVQPKRSQAKIYGGADVQALVEYG
jgi:hypothetical protein